MDSSSRARSCAFRLAPPVGRRAQDTRERRIRLGVVEAHLNVVLHRHGVEQANILERTGNTHAVDLADRLAARVVAVQQDRAARGRVHLGKQVEDRGLTGTVGADQTGDLSLADGQAKVIDCLKATEFNAQVQGLENGAESTSRSGTMEWLGTGTILPRSNSNLGICRHLLFGRLALGENARHQVLERVVVGTDHHEDQHDGIDEHAVVRELAQRFGARW